MRITLRLFNLSFFKSFLMIKILITVSITCIIKKRETTERNI